MRSASNSLMIRENTGNFRDFDPFGAEWQPKNPRLLSNFCRNSLLNRTGNYFGETGNFFGVTGNSKRGTGLALIGIALSESYPQPIETTNESERITYEEVAGLLAQARCALFPSKWPTTRFMPLPLPAL